MPIIPRALIEQIRNGRAVLLLGAGATVGAHHPIGKKIPIGNGLRDLLGKKFLSSFSDSDTLTWIAELSQSTTDLFTVQDYIAEELQEFIPDSFHKLIPTFMWRGIASTNYDTVVEQAYTGAEKSVQELVPFLSNNDRVDEEIRNPECLIYLKLHGCITRTHDAEIPLILSAEQYAQYRSGRSRLFQMLEEWASENTIVFVGHSLQDHDLRALLLELTQKIKSRPRYYLVRPGVLQEEKDLWGSKNITVLESTFQDFIEELNTSINKSFRGIAARLDTTHPIMTKFISKSTPSPALLELLSNDFEFVRDDVAYGEGSPGKFYSGFDLGWYPIVSELDVRRTIEARIIEDMILRIEEDRPAISELYAIKAEAGSGKTVLLRRVAWEAATEAGSLCLYKKSFRSPNLDAFEELARNVGERLFLFIDNATDNLGFILDIARFARTKKLPITIVTAERINEWNVHCQPLEDLLVGEYRVPYLSHAEINELVSLLEKHNSLGPALVSKSHTDRIKEFHDRAGRQLLVALHEASHGKPYEEILLDEYESITPLEAKRLYLSVCVLYRLNVPVRAGLISRVHEIPFEHFKDRLLRPLEHVIHVVNLPWKDVAYTCRHSEIAQIIFEQALTDPTERYNEYIRLLRGLNPMYAVDSDALRGLVRAKVVHDLFPNYEDAKAIFDIIKDMHPKDSYYLQQRANYERIRPSGNLILAEKLLAEAATLAPHDTTIQHTLAEVLKAKADSSKHRLEREKIRGAAYSVLRRIPRDSSSARYAAVTILKLHIDDVKDVIADHKSLAKDIETVVRETEREFESVKQRYPDDSYVHSIESDYAKLLNDDDRSLETLMKARMANPRDPYIAIRLSAMLRERGEQETAIEFIREALSSNRGDKKLNYIYATLLKEKEPSNIKEIAYYYHRSFTKWDENHESQFWYARFAFEINEEETIREAREIFQHLRNTPFSYKERTIIWDKSGGIDSPMVYHGTVSRIEATHGFVSIQGRADKLFFHKNEMSPETWSRLRAGKRVKYHIGFSLNGPTALDIEIVL
jgi:cold shock CspA family protein